MGTYTKSFGSNGGYVAGDRATIARFESELAQRRSQSAMPPFPSAPETL